MSKRLGGHWDRARDRSAATPRWKAAQHTLCKALKPFGADPRAIDAARVFRLCGTHHSGAYAIVRPLYIAPGLDPDQRWEFDRLMHEIPPLPTYYISILILSLRLCSRAWPVRACDQLRGPPPPRSCRRPQLWACSSTRPHARPAISFGASTSATTARSRTQPRRRTHHELMSGRTRASGGDHSRGPRPPRLCSRSRQQRRIVRLHPRCVICYGVPAAATAGSRVHHLRMLNVMGLC